MKLVRWTLLLFVSAMAGAVLMYRLQRSPEKRQPDPATVVMRIREVARLETLDVAVHKKIAFTPDPTPKESLVAEIFEWAKRALKPPRGRAIVFADVHMALDLEKLTQESIKLSGDAVWMVLPPIESRVEIKPDETEIIDSNLDSTQTTELLGMALHAIERDVMADKRMHGRARAASERAIRSLLLALGFESVHFVESLPYSGGSM
jgi:Protein of unknown function (DUF4230)